MRRRVADESGMVGGFEVLPFGVLVFIVGTLLLVNAWAVVDSNLAASGAAREAVRAFVETTTSAAEARDAGARAAAVAMAGHGKDVDRMTVAWDGRLERCASVTATVTYAVPLVGVPWVRAFGGHVLSTTAHHTEVVDPYRSGLVVDGFAPESCRG
jgi:hypothetical protein